MYTELLLILSFLLLIGYLLDILSPKTKIPHSIWLFLLGFGLKILSQKFEINFPEIEKYLLPIGTIALILIVLEASLELELKREKKILLFKTFFISLLSILILSLGIATFLYYFSPSDFSFKALLINALPLSVISSAVAIPASKFLEDRHREFVVYESSLSDILGIIIFNFLFLTSELNIFSASYTLFTTVLVILASGVITIFLAWLIGTIYHEVKFIPILLVLVLFYSLSKYLHLPGLIIIFLFGLTLRNVLDFKIFRKFHPEILKEELCKFDFFVKELTFLAKSLFFLLFGFFVDPSLLLNLKSFLISLLICGFIFLVRFFLLLLFKVSIYPLILITPRGLITILLWISIPKNLIHPLFNDAIVIFVISITIISMIWGIIRSQPQKAFTPEGPICKL